MHTRLFAAAAFFTLAGCASAPESTTPERNFNAATLIVDTNSEAHKVLVSVPAESAMERFEMVDPRGRTISYVAFTDTAVGGLVFIDQKLHGTLSHHDAQAFYSCRGYATATTRHWAYDAPDWAAGLIANSTPATEVKLEFSGKSTTQSIREVVGSSFMGQMKSLLGMGSNPLSVFKTLDTAHTDMQAREKYEKALKGLSTIKPGMSESRVADVVKPEDVSFVSGGLVMAYPKFLIEYFVSGGEVKVIQQPSFLHLSHAHVALFYEANVQWTHCNPAHWREALPEKQ